MNNKNYKNNTKKADNTRRNIVFKDVPLGFIPSTTDELEDKVFEDILEVIRDTRFRSLSIPLYAFRSDIQKDEEKSNKLMIVGYIKSYDSEKDTFNVFIHDAYKLAMKNINNKTICAKFGTYDKEFTKITNFIICESAVQVDAE